MKRNYPGTKSEDFDRFEIVDNDLNGILAVQQIIQQNICTTI